MDRRIDPHVNSLCSVCRHHHSADVSCSLACELRRTYYGSAISPTPAGYEYLTDVLDRAFVQAAITKGAERHADNRAFDDQPMQHIARRRGIGFILGQADKKSEEAQGMLSRGEREKAVHELLGAIVYLAGAVIYIEKEHQQ